MCKVLVLGARVVWFQCNIQERILPERQKGLIVWHSQRETKYTFWCCNRHCNQACFHFLQNREKEFSDNAIQCPIADMYSARNESIFVMHIQCVVRRWIHHTFLRSTCRLGYMVSLIPCLGYVDMRIQK